MTPIFDDLWIPVGEKWIIYLKPVKICCKKKSAGVRQYWIASMIGAI